MPCATRERNDGSKYVNCWDMGGDRQAPAPAVNEYGIDDEIAELMRIDDEINPAGMDIPAPAEQVAPLPPVPDGPRRDAGAPPVDRLEFEQARAGLQAMMRPAPDIDDEIAELDRIDDDINPAVPTPTHLVERPRHFRRWLEDTVPEGSIAIFDNRVPKSQPRPYSIVTKKTALLQVHKKSFRDRINNAPAGHTQELEHHTSDPHILAMFGL